MSSSREIETYEDVLAKRARLLKYLRSKSVPGIISVAVTRKDNRVALLVLTEPNFTGSIPECFEGTPVAVTATGSASAQLSVLTAT